jgi:hypothetical protein
MAYKNFSEVLDGGEAVIATAVNFSPLEWLVIALAKRDPLSSINKPGRIATALGALFGVHPNPGLADPRLEALRRFVVLARNLRHRLPDREVAQFLSAGFSHAQGKLIRSTALSR